MTISNTYGTTSQHFKIGDITIYTGVSPYAYPNIPDLGENGDIFLANDGTRYAKKNNIWQILITEFSGEEIPDNSLGDNGDLYRLLASSGITGVKYVKLNDTTVQPSGIKWLPITKELYSSKPNDELFNNTDMYTIGSDKYIKINGHWVLSESEFSGTVLPEARLGANGDLYFNTSNSKYYYKVNGDWIQIDTTYDSTSEPPFEQYGQNDDIWLGIDLHTLYVKENDQWVNKSYENRVFGANGKINTNYFSNGTVFEGINRRYYVKTSGRWILTNMLYRQPQNPADYLGAVFDICYNFLTNTYFVKLATGWEQVNFIGKSDNIPDDTSGQANDITYIENKVYSIINNNEVNEAEYLTNLTLPRNEDGVENDLYTIGNQVYFKNNIGWNLSSEAKDYTSTPQNLTSNVLNNYEYFIKNSEGQNINFFINENGVWKNEIDQIDQTTAPTGFTAETNAIYKTTDKYYIYSDGWFETEFEDSNTIPSDSSGVNYDIYYTSNKRYAKIDNIWVDITTNAVLNGDTDPSTNIGDIGDIYTNNISGKKFIKVEIALWTAIGTEYLSSADTPSDTFWDLNSIFENANGEYYIKTESGWELSPSYYDTLLSTPPANYWQDYYVFQYLGINENKRYVRYNGEWNETVGRIYSTDTPNDNMWEVNSIYNNGTTKFIKSEENTWVEVAHEYNSANQPDASFWANNTIYNSSTAIYIKSNDVWEVAQKYENNDLVPNVNNGLDGDVFITSDYQFYYKVDNIWRNIINVFNQNTPPKYNSFGAELSIYTLGNNERFVKHNDVWNYVYNTLNGDELPYNDTGTVGSIFVLLPDNDLYVLYDDYTWQPLGNQYTPNSDPLNGQGEYLWLYIKNDTTMMFYNGTNWIEATNIIKNADAPTLTDGSVNNVWILLSSGLYVKDNNVWGKVLTTTNNQYDIRQEIYLFT